MYTQSCEFCFPDVLTRTAGAGRAHTRGSEAVGSELGENASFCLVFIHGLNKLDGHSLKA